MELSGTVASNLVRQAKVEERERCLRVVEKWLKPDHIRLHAGEMDAQEMRSVIAVVRAIAAEVQNY